MRMWPLGIAVLLSLALSGCIAARAVGVAANVAVTAVDVTADVVGGAADVVTGGDDGDED